jgi:hypothetical protein
MNVIAAAPAGGAWRSGRCRRSRRAGLDTLIGVVRAKAIARHNDQRRLADDEATPLAAVGG